MRMKSILLFAEGTGDRKMWLAAWLEKDLLSQGTTSHEALRSLQRCMVAQDHFDKIDGRDPFSEVPPAPDLYRDMYARANPWSGGTPDGATDWSVRITTEDTGVRFMLVEDRQKQQRRWFNWAMLTCVVACVLGCVLPAPWWYVALIFAFVLGAGSSIIFRDILFKSSV